MSWSCVGAGVATVVFLGIVAMLGLAIVINLFEDRRD